MCGEKLVKLRGKEKKIRLVRLKCKLKVTVHVGTDQNIENEIFAEYKYTLNKLLVTKVVFQYVNTSIVCEI